MSTGVKSVEMHHESMLEAHLKDNVGFNVMNVVVKNLKRGYMALDSKKNIDQILLQPQHANFTHSANLYSSTSSFNMFRSLGSSSLGAISTEQHILPGEGKKKRPREQNWTAEEIKALVKLKEEGSREVIGKDWDYISQGLREEHGGIRCFKACKDQWGTLLKHLHRVEEDLKLKNFCCGIDDDGSSRDVRLAKHESQA
jgi:hypothetical protein